MEAEEVSEMIGRYFVEQGKASLRNSTADQFLLGITILVAGYVAGSYGLPGALFTVGGALLISGTIELIRLLRLESRL